jgi:Ca2+-binding EF-hand superfamily protein
MEESSRAAINILLMMTENDERTLGIESFAKLILTIVSASNTSFDDAIDEMLTTLVQEKTISEADLLSLIIGEALYEEAKVIVEEEQEVREVLDALQLGRLQKLFDLWDEDGDGQITFEELVSNMRKFQGHINIHDSVQQASLMIIGFDKDQSQTLNKIEFAMAMLKYAKTANQPLETLVDFMCLVSIMKETNLQERAYFHSIAFQATAEIKRIVREIETSGIE